MAILASISKDEAIDLARQAEQHLLAALFCLPFLQF
jgi:hypothetical protein